MTMKIIWILLGFISLILGTLGIVLPILPTVPFYLKTGNPHLNIEYRWGMNAVNASDREIWSKK